uniref:Uncharacterized protein n=1 Tax=Anopheles minimus TaxID=112268 RepID=A0A182W4T7_9DIPT
MITPPVTSTVSGSEEGQAGGVRKKRGRVRKRRSAEEPARSRTLFIPATSAKARQHKRRTVNNASTPRLQ